MISNLSGTYEQKLKVRGLATLEENQVRGDMMMFKLITGKNKSDYTSWFQLANTRDGAANTRGNTG